MLADLPLRTRFNNVLNSIFLYSQDVIAKYGEEVIVHVLGFSQHHNDAFLESLTLIGTADGSYNYISPNDGKKIRAES